MIGQDNGSFLLTKNRQKGFGDKAWKSNYLHIKQWNVITYLCSNVNDGSVKEIKNPLKSWDGRVITDYKEFCISFINIIISN